MSTHGDEKMYTYTGSKQDEHGAEKNKNDDNTGRGDQESGLCTVQLETALPSKVKRWLRMDYNACRREFGKSSEQAGRVLLRQ